MTDQAGEAMPSRLRQHQGGRAMALTVIGAVLSVLHLINAIYPFISDFDRNVMHFSGFALLAALWFPAWQSKWAHESSTALGVDLGLGILAGWSAFWFVLNEERIYGQAAGFEALDWVFAIALVVLATEFARRVAGLVIPVLIVLALTYVAVWGPWLEGVFEFRGFSWETTLWRSIYNDEGMFGNIAAISASTVFLFIIFGAFLVRSGAGDFVIALARAVAGRIAGGPGLVAVMSSALTGTISGSAVANTASTGVITIPLMRKAGYKPAFAAGVEAASSTGGQLMPPIMGAGAFVMASLTQISYEIIVVLAILPAILYFASVAFFVRIEARRLNLPPLEAEGETLGGALRKGGAPFIIPIGLLIGMLVAGYSPNYAAVFAIAAVIVSSWASANPLGLRGIFEALAEGARAMIMTAILLCSVGLVVNVIATSGIGNTFSLMIAAWSGGHLLIAIALIAVASLVLGMGLPVTAAYIVLATLSAPALAGMIADRELIALIADGALPEAAKAYFLIGAPEAMALLSEPMPVAEARALLAGLPLEVITPLRDQAVPQEAATAALLSAHMIIFWLSQDSNVTPPVALAAFTAAAIAGSKPMQTGVASWKLAKGLYIVPVLMAYSPILSGDWPEMLRLFAFAMVGIYGLAAALQGAMERPLPWYWRGIAGAAGLACLWPGMITLNLAGAVVVVAVLWVNLSRHELVPRRRAEDLPSG